MYWSWLEYPLIKLNNVTAGMKGSFYAKGKHSILGTRPKIVLRFYIINEAERKGILRPGDTIIETTSGNTGLVLLW